MLLWTEVSLQIEGCGSPSSSEESQAWQPSARGALQPLGIVPKACTNPGMGRVGLGCSLGSNRGFVNVALQFLLVTMVRTKALPGWHRPGFPCIVSGHTCQAEKRALASVTSPGSQRRPVTGSPAFGNVVGRCPASTVSYLSVPAAPGGLPQTGPGAPAYKELGQGMGKVQFGGNRSIVATPLELLDLEKNNKTEYSRVLRHYGARTSTFKFGGQCTLQPITPSLTRTPIPGHHSCHWWSLPLNFLKFSLFFFLCHGCDLHGSRELGLCTLLCPRHAQHCAHSRGLISVC